MARRWQRRHPLAVGLRQPDLPAGLSYRRLARGFLMFLSSRCGGLVGLAGSKHGLPGPHRSPPATSARRSPAQSNPAQRLARCAAGSALMAPAKPGPLRIADRSLVDPQLFRLSNDRVMDGDHDWPPRGVVASVLISVALILIIWADFARQFVRRRCGRRAYLRTSSTIPRSWDRGAGGGLFLRLAGRWRG